jgi:hypothetical protein
LHGVTILLKNQIATYNLNNTSGSTALLRARTGRDAAVVKRLREGGAVIPGKSNMTQRGNSRDPEQGNGWSADAGQALGVYIEGPRSLGKQQQFCYGYGTRPNICGIGNRGESFMVGHPRAFLTGLSTR